MPNLPLNAELAQNAQGFQGLVANAVVDPSDPLIRKTLQPVQDLGTLFTRCDTRVFVRARPILEGEPDKASCMRKIEGCKNAILVTPKVSLACDLSVEPTSVLVDGTYTDFDQTREIYDSMCRGLVEMAIGGGSSAIIAYGQTGSGKTYTTAGLMRCLARDIASAQVLDSFDVAVTFVELRNEQNCVDLISGATVNVLEDQSLNVELQGAHWTAITCPRDVVELVDLAAAARNTKATARNDTSSRSHMVTRFLVKRKEAKWNKPGVLCFADLAGSENTADSATHDKERLQETKFINTSLMTLKDCIRGRGQAAVETQKHVHIPYRRSKLTLLLRDSFELIVKRPTKTAVIACVSPLVQDVRQTYNTLKYAGLLYVSPKENQVLGVNPDDPSSWNRQQSLEFLATSSKNMCKNPEGILIEGNGEALVHIPEAEFIARAVSNCGMGEKNAKMLYLAVWKKVCDARAKLRKNIIQKNNQALVTEREKENAAALRHQVRRMTNGLQ